MAFQSIFSRFQSFCTFSPNKISMASASWGVVTTNRLSLMWICVSASGTITPSPRQMREMINFMCVICAISAMVFPARAGLMATYCAM